MSECWVPTYRQRARRQLRRSMSACAWSEYSRATLPRPSLLSLYRDTSESTLGRGKPAFRFLRHPNEPNAPRPVAKSGSAAGRGVSAHVPGDSKLEPSSMKTVVGELAHGSQTT